MTPQDVEDEARTWIGTPFHHQARVKRIGVDCAGLPEEIARKFGYAPEYFETDYRSDYSRDPDGSMEVLLSRYFDVVPFSERQQGDILHIAWAMVPQHLGILTRRGTLIHAFGRAGVVESTLSGVLLKGVRKVYRWRH